MQRTTVIRIVKELLWFVPLIVLGVVLARTIGVEYRRETGQIVSADWVLVVLGPYVARWFIVLFIWALRGLKDR